MGRDESGLPVLVASDVPYSRKLLQQILKKHGYQVSTAADLAETMKQIRGTDFRLLVIDLATPESAAEQLLLQVRVTGLKIPILLLSASLDRDLLRRLTNLKPVGFLTKPLHFESLAQLVPLAINGDANLLRRSTELSKFRPGPDTAQAEQQGLAPKSTEEMMQDAEIDENRLQRMFGQLPLLPHVVARVIQLSGDDESTTLELAEVISGDPRLCGQLLRIVNSAYFGFARRIATIPEAIVILGVDAIRKLTLGAAVANFFSGKSELLDREKLWRHSLAAAIASRKVAEAARLPNIEEAFTAGLLHDFGRLALDRHLTAYYAPAVNLARGSSIPLLKAEKQTLGFDHAWLSGWLAKKWNLPPVLSEALAWHHQPEAAEEAERSVAAVVNIGDVLCHLAELPSVEEVELTTEASPYGVGITGFDPAEQEHLVPEIQSETAELEKQLSIALQTQAG